MSKELMRTILVGALRSKPLGGRMTMFIDQQRFFGRSAILFTSSSNSISLRDGLVKFCAKLPGDKELCQFTLKPAIDRVGDLAAAINAENPSRFAQIRVSSSSDNVQYARTTPIEALLRDTFDVTIRDPHGELLATLRFDKSNSSSALAVDGLNAKLEAGAANLAQVQTVVDRLHAALHFDENRSHRRAALEARLNDLSKQLEPLERQRDEINAKAQRRAKTFSWVGLGYMGIQCGLLARLTWWEYSWDIVEPCTYFVGYATLMVYFAYYLLTRQEWTFPAAEDRQYAAYFHALADKRKFDLARYVDLRKRAYEAHAALRALGYDPTANISTITKS